jgi:hypothetical protein
MSHASTDQQIHMADAMSARIKNASLGDFVEWLTAFAICFRRAVVEGKTPEPDIAKIALELIKGIDQGLPDTYEGADADERRKLHAKVEAFVAAMKPAVIADLMDEMAESYREVLLYQNADRVGRFHHSLDGDIALVSSPLVRDLVRLDRDLALDYETVEEDRIMADCAASAAS